MLIFYSNLIALCLFDIKGYRLTHRLVYNIYIYKYSIFIWSILILITKLFYNCLIFISRSEIFIISLILFLITLIIGTISQKYIGIQSVKDIYFNSNVFYIYNIIPLPGGKLLFIIIFFNLLFKLILNKIKINTILIHVSILLLLIGSYLEYKFSETGYLILDKNIIINNFVNENNYSITINYNNKILNTNIIKNNVLNKTVIAINDINNNKITLIKFFKNINMNISQNNLKKTQFNKNLFYDIKEISCFVEHEHVKTGILCIINNENFFILEGLTYIINNENIQYSIILTKTKDIMPFTIKLLEFERDVYQKTDTAKSYTSTILITSNDLKNWKFNIKMNNPLKYKQFIFYQSSFIKNDQNVYSSILNVKKNSFSFVFYFASIVMFLGFMLNIYIFFNHYRKKI